MLCVSEPLNLATILRQYANCHEYVTMIHYTSPRITKLECYFRFLSALTESLFFALNQHPNFLLSLSFHSKYFLPMLVIIHFFPISIYSYVYHPISINIHVYSYVCEFLFKRYLLLQKIIANFRNIIIS